MKIKEMLEIFQAGKEVANPAYWKHKTINMNKLVLVVSGAVGILNMFDCSFCDIQLSSDQLIGIATGIISVVSVFNMGSTAATSTKVGLIGKKKSDKTSNNDHPSEGQVSADEDALKEVDSNLIDDIEKLQ